MTGKRFSIIGLFLLISTSLCFSVDILDVRTMYLEAVQYLANGDLAEAESGFRAILSVEEFSDDDDQDTLERYQGKSYYFLGDISFMNEQYEDSIDFYQVIVRLYSGHEIYPRTLYKLGRALVLNEQYGEGVAILYDYLGKYENTDDLEDNTLYWIGRAYTFQNDYQMAINALELILTQYPDTPLAYEVRTSLTTLRDLLAQEQEVITQVEAITDEYTILQQENEALQKEKELLESISELLYIKQRLLELKADKIDLLAEIRAEREAE